MVGPSAVGSEKGIPSSIQSAPPRSKARRILSVVSRSGSPAVTNGMSAASPRFLSSVNFAPMRLMFRRRSEVPGSSLRCNGNFRIQYFEPGTLNFEPALQLHSQILPDRHHILISPAGEIDNDGVMLIQAGRKSRHCGNRVGALQSGNDAFHFRE